LFSNYEFTTSIEIKIQEIISECLLKAKNEVQLYANK